MVAYLFAFLVLLILVYAYRSHRSQFAATTSAIQDIWSGHCRHRCCSSTSGYSGVSGLNNVPIITQMSDNSVFKGDTPSSNGCVCQSCPCAVVKRVVDTCAPASQMYEHLFDFVSAFFYNGIEAIAYGYQSLGQTMQCGTSCQREAYLVDSNRDGTQENFVYKIKATAQLKELHRRFSDFSLHSRTDPKSGEGTSKMQKGSPKKTSAVTIKDDVKALSSQQSCTKCVEKGKVCMSNCPKANKNVKKE